MSRLVGTERPAASESRAAGARGVEPRASAFANQPSFELREGRHHVKHERAAGGGGIDGFGQGRELDTAFAEVSDQVDKPTEGAAQAIEPPYDQRVAWLEPKERVVQTRAGEAGSGDTLIRINVFATCALECIELKVEVLFAGGDAGISDFHGCVLKKTTLPGDQPGSVDWHVDKNDRFCRCVPHTTCESLSP